MPNNFDKILRWILILSPIVYWKGMPDLVIKEGFFIFSCGILLAFSFWVYPKRTGINKQAFFILILASLTYLFNMDQYVLGGTVVVIFCVLIYSLIYKYAISVDLEKVFMIVVIANVALMISQLLGYDPIYNHWNCPGAGETVLTKSDPRPCGFMLSTTNMGFYLTLSTCFLPLWMTLGIVPFIWITGAKIAIFAASLTIFFRLNQKYSIGNKMTQYFMGLYLVFCCLVLKFEYGLILKKLLVRWESWSRAIPMIFERVYGYGAGFIKNPIVGEFVSGNANVTVKNLHCQYLDILFAFGFLGLFIGIVYLRSIFKKMDTPLGMAVIVCLICFCFQSYLQSPMLLITIVSIFALKEVENVS